MTEFTGNSSRVDPYKNYKFRVKWDGKYIAGVSKVSTLKRATEVLEHRDGTDPTTTRKSPGRTEFEPVTLERGLTNDHDFEEWANLVWKFSVSPESALANFRKDIIIDVFNEAGQRISSYKVHRCWVSEYQALDLDANANVVAIEHIRLENEGWERDTLVTEPLEQERE